MPPNYSSQDTRLGNAANTRQGRARPLSAPAAPKLTPPLPRAQIKKMRTLLVVLFALVVSCSALAAAPEAEASTRSAINLAQSAPTAAPAGAAAPAKPFYDPLLMYNPYMCATPAAPPRAPLPPPPPPRRHRGHHSRRRRRRARASGCGRARRGIRPRRAGGQSRPSRDANRGRVVGVLKPNSRHVDTKSRIPTRAMRRSAPRAPRAV